MCCGPTSPQGHPQACVNLETLRKSMLHGATQFRPPGSRGRGRGGIGNAAGLFGDNRSGQIPRALQMQTSCQAHALQPKGKFFLKRSERHPSWLPQNQWDYVTFQPAEVALPCSALGQPTLDATGSTEGLWQDSALVANSNNQLHHASA